jgi:hypothetical protein
MFGAVTLTSIKVVMNIFCDASASDSLGHTAHSPGAGGPACGLATELGDTFKAVPVVTGGELIISRPVFTRLVLIAAHAKSIDANRHMMANRPVDLGLWRGAF